MAELSPMMKQYFELKKKHPDEILFFRLGDFYEMFFEDAITASRELELTLTGRDCGQEERAPMCGVPHHSCEGYIARLIAKGFKVAICEQMENPSDAKGIVKRDVVRVITPGTVIESSMLQDDKNNYIASIYIVNGAAGVCVADVSTGTAYATCVGVERVAADIISELSRYSPKEVLFNQELLSFSEVTSFMKQQLACSAELLDDEIYEKQICHDIIINQFGDNFSKETGVQLDSLAYYAIAALLGYLQQTQKKGVERLKTVKFYAQAHFMRLSSVTRANLELSETMRGREKKGTLLWVLDQTQTSMGKRLMRTWVEQPLVNASAINLRLDGVQELSQATIKRTEIIEILKNIFDMERLTTRIVYGSALPREMLALSATCAQLPLLKNMLTGFISSEIIGVVNGLDILADVREMIEATIDENAPIAFKDGGIIKKGFNEQVDELRDIIHGSKGFLMNLEAKLKEETGIRTLKIGYNRVFGYYIETSRSFADSVPANFIRKQTLANAERYITEDLKQLESKILDAGDRIAILERQVYDELLENVSKELARIQKTAQNVAQIDVLTSLAQVAIKNNYVRPIVNDEDKLIIEDGRHPVIEKMLKTSLFVPNDSLLDCEDNRLMIITGPNMAGKSTYMRQTAIIALMAHIGSFVPAKNCIVGVTDAIFTRVGAQDDLSAGKSTFMVEMTEVAEILTQATSKSLVILDEIGRGTSTFDGMSIARAVVEHIADKDIGLGCKTLFATHYHELTELENALDGVKNYNIAVKKRGDDITFLRRIVRGPADDSYGIEVAKLAGIPQSVIKRAKEVLKVLEANAPNADKITQLDFANFEKFAETPVPSELVDKLKSLDVETLTPIEALNYLYELKSVITKN